MKNRSEKEREEREYQQQLYDCSPKRELWDNMKAWGHSTVFASYIAGCAIAMSILTNIPLKCDLAGMLFVYTLVLIMGAVIGAIILTVVTTVSHLSGNTIPLSQKVIMALLTPVAVILLCIALRLVGGR